MGFVVFIEEDARKDIQEAIRWYNKKKKGLGKEFHRHFLLFVSALSQNPMYQVRYDEVHCLPLKKFPYMIHFVVSKKNVIIYGVFHTSLNPDKFLTRKVK